MAKLAAAQLKDKFCGLVGRITSCGRAGHKDAAAGPKETQSAAASHPKQPERIRSRGVPPSVSAGSNPDTN
ncbi:hypothetical protein GUJ93_ZPchr0010g10653 [Zizania palustris]|uniref:Uncharacterized protein n=1 Tax=Zizania palustris TaxID=103762 RepID=A0A8J5WAD2_ZIZPA|nr:hypothetical protein GUJ93_ZPchr0010g10653 [Zizania palustris]